MARKKSPIRVGVVGVGRGRSFMRAAHATGMELVAICDTWEERLQAEGTALGVATYVDYEQFLAHDMDAVVLANYFHEHAPFAIRALKADKHVMSETSACHTLGEGVALARAAARQKAGPYQAQPPRTTRSAGSRYRPRPTRRRSSRAPTP